jgi:hypothetical protein
MEVWCLIGYLLLFGRSMHWPLMRIMTQFVNHGHSAAEFGQKASVSQVELFFDGMQKVLT